MKANELRNKKVNELEKEHLELLEEQFKLRMQKATGQLAKHHQLQVNKRNIARVLTVLNEIQRGQDHE